MKLNQLVTSVVPIDLNCHLTHTTKKPCEDTICWGQLSFSISLYLSVYILIKVLCLLYTLPTSNM